MQPDKNDSLAAIRTLIPLVVGYITSFLISKGLDVDETEVRALLTLAGSVFYWLAAYFAQKHDIKILKHLLPGNNPKYDS